MTDPSDYLDAVRQRVEAATDEPWTWAARTTADGDKWAVFPAEDYELAYNDDGWAPDAEFIAHARTDVPRLVAALRAVVGILDGHRTPPCLDCMHADCLMENDIRTAINDSLGGTS